LCVAVEGSDRAEAIRSGIKVVLAGHPNTGKSSLLNALVGREAAIVSAIPGTTRDAIEVLMDVGGFPVRVTDTAGLRGETNDEIELLGMVRTRKELQEADIVLWVCSPDVVGSEVVEEGNGVDLIVLGKSDLRVDGLGLLRNKTEELPVVEISALHGSGLDELTACLNELVEAQFSAMEDPVVVGGRQRDAIEESIRLLNDALDHNAGALELKAEDVRRAANAIGRITGRTEVEEWLGAIFSKFCIGK
jgi:tRNA modification GTPase